MNEFTFSKEGWADYKYWESQDKKTLKRINDLMDDIQRQGLLGGKGKPEQLKYRPGEYSRRIDETNRLVYEQNDKQDIRIISCRGHYED